jgi:hypothetical protein
MHDLAKFSFREMVQCSVAVRQMGVGARSMEEVARRIVRYLYDALGDTRGSPACALVRFYKSHAYGLLDDTRRGFAASASGAHAPTSETRCLTLLGTAGDEPAWNDVLGSKGHLAIPLPSEEVVRRLPMVAQLVAQLGVDLGSLLKPDPSLMVDAQEQSFNVFYVPEASGSSFVPAQEFVARHGVRSVLGFGGLLPSGDLFAIILFAKIPVEQSRCELFKTLALSVRVAVVPFGADAVFGGS